MKTIVHRPDGGLPYAVMTPSDQPGALPVVLFLHDADQRGDDGLAPTTVGLGPALQERPGRWPVVAVFPQCPAGETWTGSVLVEALGLLNEAVRAYTRLRGPVAATGIGMGGTGVWEAAARWPTRWSRVVPIGASRPEVALTRARNVPIWIHHGAGDTVVPIARLRRAVRQFAETATHLRFDQHDGAGPAVWGRVYGDPEVARWLVEPPEAGGAASEVQPVFIGGTGRSGTTAMSSIIVRHPDFVRTPELRIHGRDGGLFDVLAGAATPRSLASRAQRHWFYRWWPGAAPLGLHRIIDEGTWTQVLRRYVDEFDERPYEVTRDVMRMMLDPVARANNARSWVEHSPLNGRNAHTLHRLFPELKMIHTIRDGRDTAVSMTRQSWGPDNAEDGVREWAHRLRETWHSTRALPADQLLEVRWEEFVQTDREGQLARVLSFLGIGETPSMREFFDTNVSAAKAHTGRWRTDLPAAEADRVDKLYRELLDELRDEGVGCLPVPPD